MSDISNNAFAVKNLDLSTRLKSSSGGVFSLLAQKVILKGGVVFGATFDENFNVIHKYAETLTDVEQFRGSKYVKSINGDCYKQAKKFLEDGRLVLFTGTPCQIGGLVNYLGKSYDNLITQDIICHGSPMPVVWQKYKDYREKVAGSKIKGISFRNKSASWKNYSVEFLFENNKNYSAPFHADPYMRLFLRNVTLIPSCYNCKFKGVERKSDITLADFWGIDTILPEFDDDKGTSLVICHSQKGKELFYDIQDQIEYVKVDLEKAIAYNPSIINSAVKPQNKKVINDKIEDMSFSELEKIYLTGSQSKCKGFFKKVIRKLFGRK